MDENITELAPHPWCIVDHTTARAGYLCIADATGNPICEFFPFGKGGRGKEATLALAEQMLNWEQLLIAQEIGVGSRDDDRAA